MWGLLPDPLFDPLPDPLPAPLSDTLGTTIPPLQPRLLHQLGELADRCAGMNVSPLLLVLPAHMAQLLPRAAGHDEVHQVPRCRGRWPARQLLGGGVAPGVVGGGGGPRRAAMPAAAAGPGGMLRGLKNRRQCCALVLPYHWPFLDRQGREGRLRGAARVKW